MRRSDLPRIIAEMNEVVHAAALRPELWQELADRLSDHTGGAKVTMQTWDRRIATPLPLIVAGWTSEQLENYAAYYAGINPWKQAWIDMPFMAAAWSDDCLPTSELRKTECWADFLRVHKADSATGIKLIDEPDRLATFAVNYEMAKGERTHSLLQPLIKRLAPGMRRAIEINKTIYRSTSLAAAETNLLTALLDPAFVVDGTCRLLAANAPAEKLIADGALLRVGAQDLLQFDDPQCDRLFSERIRRACNPPFVENPPGLDDLMVKHPSGCFTVTMMLVRQNFHSMTLSGVLPLFLPATVALVVLRPRPKRAAAEELRARYRLTEAETAVTLALLNASTLAQVADTLGISYETVRSHLRAAFVKTGTNKQKQLVALAVSLLDMAHPTTFN